MDIPGTNSETFAVQRDTLLGAQVQMFHKAKDQGQAIMDTLLSSINTVQPAASVEPHLGNKIDVKA